MFPSTTPCRPILYPTMDWLRSLYHASTAPYLTPDSPALGKMVTVRLRAALDAPIRTVFLRTTPDGQQEMVPMRRMADGEACQWWQFRLKLTMPRTNYRFLLHSDDSAWWLNAAGVSRSTPLDAQDFKLLAGFGGPRWLRDAVFYQIFPERFADGDPSNNVRDGAYLCYGQPVAARKWGARPRRSWGGREFYGGDLQGIAQRLDYLEQLGVTALYLNPIFRAPSNHKYDIADYEHVDPHLGGNEALATLRRALDERGMRLLLDIAPNHCGSTHPWFLAAQADPDAPTADFFTFHKHPDDYEAWLGVRSLPKLDYRSERLRQTMYAAPEAIMRRWLHPPYRIDGWRVDVANMLARQGASQLGHKVGRGIRRAIKQENPDAYLLGENYFDGTPHLQGDELDATMNYSGFAFPLLHWLAHRDPPVDWGASYGQTNVLPTATLAEQWLSFLGAIPWQVAMQQFNLLGSHDIARISTRLGKDGAKLRVAVALLFTFPGVPSCYYGDEIGLEGGEDPYNRGAMPWDEKAWDHDLRAFYRRLIALRRSSSAIQRGCFQLLHAAGETVAFLRGSPEERLIVVARRGADSTGAIRVAHAAIADGTPYRALIGTGSGVVQGGQMAISLADVGAAIYRVG